MATLERVSAEHSERLLEHVNKLPQLADEIDIGSWHKVAPRLADEHAFLVETLVPHMEAVERGIHAELDRLLSCRLAMEPMEREHAEVRNLLEQLGSFTEKASLTDGEVIELSRIVLKLYAIVKVHLREESLYIAILEHNLSPEQESALVGSLEHRARVSL